MNNMWEYTFSNPWINIGNDTWVNTQNVACVERRKGRPEGNPVGDLVEKGIYVHLNSGAKKKGAMKLENFLSYVNGDNND